MLVPGGFGVRGIEGKLGALRWARENLVPTLGICLGLQCMVIEYARTILGLDGASSSEFDADPAHPVIATMAEQLAIVGGDGRPGRHHAARRLRGRADARVGRRRGVRRRPRVSERHRHRYEVNNAYRDKLEAAGLVISGRLARHARWSSSSSCRATCTRTTCRTQAHPEFKSRPTRAHPLFAGLIEAALAQRRRRVLMAGAAG